MARYVSFRFDDGFLSGARTAAQCLAPDCGTFFLISDLVCEGAAGHEEQLFRGRDFGSVADWQALAATGQDIQLHGRSHRNMKLLTHEQQLGEIAHSLALTRSIHDGPYVFCHPFNSTIELDFAALGLAGAGFRTRTSDHQALFHDLAGNVDRYALNSWAVRERHFATVVKQLALLPDDCWIILALHSLEGEGHEPWSQTGFASLVAACRELDIEIATISAIVERLAA